MKIRLEMIFIVLITIANISLVSSCYPVGLSVVKKAKPVEGAHIEVKNYQFNITLTITGSDSSEYHNYELDRSLIIRNAKFNATLIEFKCKNDSNSNSALVIKTWNKGKNAKTTTWECERESNNYQTGNLDTRKKIQGEILVFQRTGNWTESTTADIRIVIHHLETVNLTFFFLFVGFVGAHVLTCFCGGISICYQKKHPRPPSRRDINLKLIKEKIREINEAYQAQPILEGNGAGDSTSAGALV